MWSSLFKMKSEVLDMPVVVRADNKCNSGKWLTRVHFFFNPLLSLAQQEELETVQCQLCGRRNK